MNQNNAPSPRWTRQVGPATTSVVTFSAVPELIVTLRRLEGSDPKNLPAVAADIADKVSRLEVAEGGDGLVPLRGAPEKKDALVLRLLPKRADIGAGQRLQNVSTKLNALLRRVRADLADKQHDGFDALSEELLGSVEAVVVQ